MPVFKKGDTLSAIAARNKTTVAALMKANPQIKNANQITAGASYTLPGAAKVPAKKAAAAPAKKAAAPAPKPAAPKPATPVVTPAGTVTVPPQQWFEATPPVVSPEVLTALPYYGDLDEEESFAEQEYNAETQNATADETSALARWMSGTRDVEEEAPGIYRRILNNNAARGMAFSSGFAKQDEDARRGVAQTLAGLLDEKTSVLNASNLRKMQALERRNSKRASVARRKAERAAGGIN